MALSGRDILIFLAVKYNGDWNKIYEAIKNKEMVDEQIINETLAETSKYNTLVIIDDDYPESLKKIYKPPFVLFLDKHPRNALDRQRYTLGVMEGAKKATHVEIAELSTLLNQMLEVNNTQLCGLNGDEIFEMGTKIKRGSSKHIRVLTTGIEHASRQDNVINVSEYFKGPHQDENNSWASRLVTGISSAFYTPTVAKSSKNQVAIGYGLYLGKHIMLNRSTTKLSMDLFKNGAIMVDSYEDIEKVMYHNSDEPTPDKTKLEGSPLV